MARSRTTSRDAHTSASERADEADEIADQLRQTVGALVRRARAARLQDTIAYPLQTMIKRLDFNGPSTTADLARAELITPQTAGSMVAQLEKDGLVTRKDDPADGRRRLVLLTPRGQALLTEGRTRSQAWLADQIRDRLDASEIKSLAAAIPLLRKLVS